MISSIAYHNLRAQKTSYRMKKSFPGIPIEKTTAIQLILNNKMLGWRASLRKTLVVVFGVNVLANACAMGKRNATFNKLDSALLRSIKGIYN